MKPYFADGPVTLYHGDCLDVLRTLPPDSVDAVCTDPPYALGFMGQKWDTHTPRGFQHWCEAWAKECLRILKPGGHLLAFGGTRTYHRLACAIEDAGFEIRDSIHWITGAGFPKSHSVHKATLVRVESRYAKATCNCLDTSDGRLARDDVRQSRSGPVGARRGEGEVPQDSSRHSGLSADAGSGGGPLRELRGDGREEGAGPAPVEATVLFKDLRGSRPEAPGLGHVAVRAGLEEHPREGAAAGPDLPIVREASDRGGAACPSPQALPVRRDELSLESGGSVRLVSPHDRGSDDLHTGVDRDRRESRRVHLDDQGGRQDPVARICSWCGLPDQEWLDSLIPLGSALKPAHEPIVVARKPLAGTVAANVLEYGTGALNIAATRVETSENLNGGAYANTGGRSVSGSMNPSGMNRPGATAAGEYRQPAGRWPANVVLDEDAAAEMDRQSGHLHGAKPYVQQTTVRGDVYQLGSLNDKRGKLSTHHGDSGGASRFFPVFRYEAKADTAERPLIVNGVGHPTVKPLALMRWLVRLVTPPGGLVLDPFLGSGTTAEACILERFRCVGVEQAAEYLPHIQQRIDRHRDPVAFLESRGETEGTIFDLLEGTV